MHALLTTITDLATTVFKANGPEVRSAPVKIWSAEEFLAREIQTKKVLVENLLHARDLVSFGARRRHGKTTFLLNLGIAGALGGPHFIKYPIPGPFRSLLFMLEDDPGELQTKLKLMVDGRNLEGRLYVVTRDDFYERDIQVDIRADGFKETISRAAEQHLPELIVFDNLAQILSAEYNDPKLVHELMTFAYKLARKHNAAIVFAAHPKKADPEKAPKLEGAPELFVEQIMGTSHFINSTGSIWALERYEAEGYGVFMGGRQRGEGHHSHTALYLDDKQWFQLYGDVAFRLKKALNTDVRAKAWQRLPDPPQEFGYNEAEQLVEPVMKSASTFHGWFKACQRNEVIIPLTNGKYRKADNSAKGTMTIRKRKEEE